MEIKQNTTKNERVKEEIKCEIKRFKETNVNDYVLYQNFWDAAKAVIRGTCMSLQAYLKNKRNPK